MNVSGTFIALAIGICLDGWLEAQKVTKKNKTSRLAHMVFGQIGMEGHGFMNYMTDKSLH